MKRRKSKKTDYKQRLGLLKSRKPRFVVRRNLKQIIGQVVNYEPDGDKVVLEVTSNHLKEFGWLGHGGNLPAAYLTGLLLGKKAIGKNISEGVLDIGLQKSVKGNALYSFAKGVKDSGISIPLNKKILPSKERISGKHIEEYASKIENKEEHFSSYIKKGLDPSKLTEHFEKVKKKIGEKNEWKNMET